MTDTRAVWLVIDLVDALHERFSSSDHLMQQVTQEERGRCLPPRDGCRDHCAELRALRDEALDWLEQQAAEQPRQLRMEVLG